MLDNFNLEIIKKSKQLDNSLIAAITTYCEEHEIYDFEDVTELLDPILIEKLKTEFYLKKYIPSKKINNSLSSFFD